MRGFFYSRIMFIAKVDRRNGELKLLCEDAKLML